MTAHAIGLDIPSRNSVVCGQESSEPRPELWSQGQSLALSLPATSPSLWAFISWTVKWAHHL